MSRVGKKPIPIPKGVIVTLEGQKLRVVGPKGELSFTAHPHVTLLVTRADEREEVHVTVRNPEDAKDRALWGLTRSLVRNMVQGVTEGFRKQLEVVGIGYKVALQGRKLVLEVGFSHPVPFEMPLGIDAMVDKNTITITGVDKQLVGEIAARIRAIKKPEPYKGKGIKYADEVVRRKAGKAVKTGAPA